MWWLLALIGCKGPEVATRSEGAPPAPVAPPRTRVVVLGTGTPVPDPGRSGPCVAVVVDDTAYLVDMGPGLVRRAAAATGLEPAVDPVHLERVFVTHLHSDHTVGFPDLWLSPWVIGRRGPLRVWGPPGIAAMARHVEAAWSEDVALRIEGAEGSPSAGAGLQVQEIDASSLAPPGVVYRDERVEVRAFAVPHGTWKQALGYRFAGPDRTVVISGDTAPSEAVVAACDGCDVLVHEVYSKRGFDRVAGGSFARYHRTFHTSTAELAELAARARPKLLVLYHQLYMGADDRLLVEEVRSGWDGEVVSATDLGVY